MSKYQKIFWLEAMPDFSSRLNYSTFIMGIESGKPLLMPSLVRTAFSYEP